MTDSARPRILIIDDHPLLRQGIGLLIAQEKDMTVCGEADDAARAMAAIEQTSPDVIILDVVLPGRSGYEVCRDIKAEAETKKIPVVICSTKCGEMDKFWGMKQGADAYLAKPVDQDELVRTVKQLIKR